MRYHVLAVDYDGTIAHHGKVDEATIDALKKCKQSQRKILLVTGRELDELIRIFPEHGIFDLIVAENGALIYNPSTGEEKLLGEKPPEGFIRELVEKGVSPLSVGRVIVATWEPHQATVLQAIRNAGIEYQVIFNKGAVMVLPPGINKAKGLDTALHELKISAHNVVAAGDAENDQAMLRAAECSVAVSNALPSVKDEASYVTRGDHGAGIAELIEMLLDDDLSTLGGSLRHGGLMMGAGPDGSDFVLNPYRNGVMIAGTSGGGKSTLTSAFLEALSETGHQYCIMDPEGDYINFPGAVTAGDGEHEPVIDEVMAMLENPFQNVVVCLLAITLDRRPHFFNELLGRIAELRNQTGRPHWFVIDEAHHLLPSETEDSFFSIPANFINFLLITTNPSKVNKSILEKVDSIMMIGDEPGGIWSEFASVKNLPVDIDLGKLERGSAWVWEPGYELPIMVHTRKPEHVIRRHIKKYATGTMQYNEFYFKGPAGKLNLKAPNVVMFMQMAEGVDDETWVYHLKRHDYSNWFENALHDEELASLASEVEVTEADAGRSRSKILELVRERYTL